MVARRALVLGLLTSLYTSNHPSLTMTHTKSSYDSNQVIATKSNSDINQAITQNKS